ncbi:MAG: hypothetical protein U9N77_07980 [Thermodesulfobacteriota bacterium]|nr:hypothetical protein [Thermodesulfobacteriota bacterium]
MITVAPDEGQPQGVAPTGLTGLSYKIKPETIIFQEKKQPDEHLLMKKP